MSIFCFSPCVLRYALPKKKPTQTKLQNSVHIQIEDATMKTHALTYLLFPHRVEHVSAAVARKRNL